MFRLLSLITILLFSFQVTASCVQPVQSISEGEVATCDGYLFSPEKEKEIRQIQKNMEFYKLVSEQQESIIKDQDELNTILNKRVNLYKEGFYDLHDEYVKQESRTALQNGLYFALGAFVTAIIARNVH